MFKIKKIGQNLIQVQYTVFLDYYTLQNNKNHSFPLDSTLRNYSLNFEFATNSNNTYQQGFVDLKILLRLEKEKAARKKNAISTGEEIPASVWASVNDGEVFVLTQRENRWETDFFRAQLSKRNQHRNYASYEQEGQEIQVWMQFEHPKPGQSKTLEDFLNMFKQQSRCDVQFCAPHGVALIKAHANILCARSPVFEAMFHHDTKESKTRIIEVPDVKPHILQEFLRYLYSGAISGPLSDATAQELYEVSNKYDVASLREECISYLLSNIRVENAINLLAWSNLFAVETLKEKTIEFVANHGKKIFTLTEWVEFTKKYPELSVAATRKMLEHVQLNNPQK